ncbi:MAG TPA: MarR family transcriptional regulator [Pseudolysinimonas sp.]|nr:MarR family transcriptional regulator [Pseudolysinimonas sp.]
MDEELRLLIQRVARRIRNNRAGEDSDTRLGVLFHLEGGDHTPGELAAQDHVSPPSMNRTLNGLERDGLVQRRPAEDDARKVHVSITDAGLARIRETRALRTAWLARQLQQLSDDERRLLEAAIPVLRKLADS